VFICNAQNKQSSDALFDLDVCSFDIKSVPLVAYDMDHLPINFEISTAWQTDEHTDTQTDYRQYNA